MNQLDVRVEYHSPDFAFCAVILRDGEPWFLNGAMVGMGRTRGEAVDELIGIAENLVVVGENFLTDRPLSIEDRQRLFHRLDYGQPDDLMYMALRTVRDKAVAFPSFQADGAAE